MTFLVTGQVVTCYCVFCSTVVVLALFQEKDVKEFPRRPRRGSTGCLLYAAGMDDIRMIEESVKFLRHMKSELCCVDEFT